MLVHHFHFLGSLFHFLLLFLNHITSEKLNGKILGLNDNIDNSVLLDSCRLWYWGPSFSWLTLQAWASWSRGEWPCQIWYLQILATEISSTTVQEGDKIFFFNFLWRLLSSYIFKVTRRVCPGGRSSWMLSLNVFLLHWTLGTSLSHPPLKAALGDRKGKDSEGKETWVSNSMVLQNRVGKPCEGTDVHYVRLCRPYGFACDCSGLPC